MIPSKSNLSKENCSPISSNCVIWQGPNIECINLCNGDTVSDVTYKLAEEICELKQQLDLTDLDLTCIVNVCSNCQVCEPEKMLATVLQLLIDKICCLNDIVINNNSGGSEYVEPILNLPFCLQYIEDGQLITKLVHSQYTLRVASFICSLNTTVNNHTTQINNLTTNVTAINNWSITPSCSYPPTVPSAGVATPIRTLIEAFEDKMCQLSTILGSVTQIQSAINAICSGLNTKVSLSNPPVQMQNFPGWNVSTTTLAESIENLWITVCDIRTYVENCNCGTVTYTPCDDIDLSSITSSCNINELGQITISIDYTGISLPSGSTNCFGNAVVRISDSDGNLYTSSVNLTTVSGIVNYNLPTTFLPGNELTIEIEYCFTIDGINCDGVYTLNPAISCPQLQSISSYFTNPT